MITVECRGTLPSGVTKRLINELIEVAFHLAGSDGDAALSVSSVDERTIMQLNKTYRGEKKVTDVLSFGYDEGVGDWDVTEHGVVRQLGDIVICLPQVRRQAKEAGRTVREEYAVMVVHGTLHLLGFDHDTPAKERKMFALQQDALHKTGII